MKIRLTFFFLVCAVMGILFVTQAKTTEGQSLYVSAETVMEYKTSIESEKKEIGKIEDLIQQKKDQLAIYENALKEDQGLPDIAKELSSEVEKYKMAAGYQTVQGSGVKIVIDDGTRSLYEGENDNNVIVHDIDIMMVVNDLRRCGAEAISVNGQRIIDTTSIACSGYTIRINGQVYARPFVIRAVGNGKRMAASLISLEGYGTSLKSYGVQFSVELVDDITISGYSGTPKYKYMLSAKEGGEI